MAQEINSKVNAVVRAKFRGEWTDKLQGTSADSNILKIYGMLDRDNGDKHYYQPGIGTYVNTRSISHTSRIARLNSWYQKAKDSAVGTSFDEHVMGAYKFLMQSYDDNDIYIFGFSRGAYVARFLAEMLDHVGLLSRGNEEMARFAWKAFAQWQEREDTTDEEKKKKKELLNYLQAFRETFSRPVRRIRFLGLFDTGERQHWSETYGLLISSKVNSVPRFENAWMKRTKFPYTARSTAKIIRHAVSIDERRAKFRQDLISASKASGPGEKHHHHRKGRGTERSDERTARANKPNVEIQDRFRRKSRVRAPTTEDKYGRQVNNTHISHLDPNRGLQTRLSSQSPTAKRGQDLDASSFISGASTASFQPGNHPEDEDDDDADEADDQDIEEIWFPGCHADLGGGWPLADGEESALSHAPLVWMVREAQRAGLEFDGAKLFQFHCSNEDYNIPSHGLVEHSRPPPDIYIEGSPIQERPDIFRNQKSEHEQSGWASGLEPESPRQSDFHRYLLDSSTKGRIHDCLLFNNGLPAGAVLSWKIMEYLPFRRMDLRPDGSWKAISFPLPMGEVRDIPADARIHHSAIRRMEANEDYRPGNLIIGGGGRGVRKAPPEMGIGDWEIFKEEGDAVGQLYVRKGSSPEKRQDEKTANGKSS
ncbi:hypothetical protein ACLMJK_006641 [Lecanora helva]